MTFPEKQLSKYNPKEQIELLRLQCKRLMPELYNLNDLYLNYLRSILSDVVRKAVFNLLTEQNLYNLEPPSLDVKKLSLTQIDSLVSKSNSILTIEQLMHISNNIEKEHLAKLKKSQDNIINELNQNLQIRDESDESSVSLSSNSPLTNPSKLDIRFLNQEISFENDLTLTSSNNYSLNELPVFKNNQSLYGKSLNQINSDIEYSDNNNGIDIFKKIFSIVGKPFNNDVKKNKKKTEDHSSPETHFLPEDPLALFQWMSSLDIALKRVLRDLSNSINVELMRSGLINNLMPVSLLDAVIDGQINSQDSSSNLLKLNIPIHTSSSEDGLDVTCILLRPSELEFDFPKLRSYRSVLRKNRNILIKMIKQHRHWQNRSFADDISQQWLQSPQSTNKASNVRD